jgi:hypothetical protein
MIAGIAVIGSQGFWLLALAIPTLSTFNSPEIDGNAVHIQRCPQESFVAPTRHSRPASNHRIAKETEKAIQGGADFLSRSASALPGRMGTDEDP